MHIPDGYLGPQTYLPLFATMMACWSIAIARLKKSLRLRQVPLLSLGAAFVFVIMMFNVPIPGGTTGHAVGAVVVAILFGPWAAVIVVSLALIVQALIFGDGGITAIGANCLNMAVVMPFAGWGLYRLIAGSSPAQSKRRLVGAAIGGYLGVTLAAVTTGLMLGIQPLIAHDAAGHALYSPFGLSVAVPVMALEHLLVFGFVEGIVTALVVAYCQRTASEMIVPAIDVTRKPIALAPKIALGLGILVLLTPLGVYLPAHFNAGAAWGEWSSEEIKAKVGYVPQGIRYAEEHAWKAPLPDYSLPGQEDASLASLSGSYILAGALGMMLIGFSIILGKRFLVRKDEADAPSCVDA